jgi:hypothetical protein
MTNDHNDFVPAQEKLEWVTPKISLMEAGDTGGKLEIEDFSERTPTYFNDRGLCPTTCFTAPS